MEIEERDFFKDLFSEAELEELMTLAPPSELFSWRSPSFRKMNLDKATWSLKISSGSWPRSRGSYAGQCFGSAIGWLWEAERRPSTAF